MEHDAPKRKARLLLVLYAACTLAIMVFIFFMSAQEGEESSSMSDTIVQWLLSLFMPGFDSWEPAAQEQLFGVLTHLVRKAAHMFEYAVLAVFATLTFQQAAFARHMGAVGERDPAENTGELLPTWKQALAGLGLATAYAATDEFHQLFVDGRSALVGDVLIDACGAAIGAVLVMLVLRRWRARNGR